MSASEESKQHLANLIMNHPALPAVREDIQRILFKRWLRGTEAERTIISTISDNEQLFYKELTRLQAESVNLEEEPDPEP